MTSPPSDLATSATADADASADADADASVGAGRERVVRTVPEPVAGAVPERVRHPLVARRLAVVHTADLGPTLRRITLGGPGLADFAAVGVTDHVKLFVPNLPGGEPVMPQVVDGEWVDRHDPALTYREYTVRTHSPGAEGLVLEMVTGERGPAARWAAQAKPGQEVGVLGPKTSVLRPLDRDRYVLAVDQSGLPALRNWLDRLPPSAQVTALIEVAGPADEVPLPSRADLDVTWLHDGHDGAPTGDDDAPAGRSLLADAVERLVGEHAVGGGAAGEGAAGRGGPAAGSRFWWAAAEAGQVRRIRAAVVAAGVDRGSWAMSAYWRRGVAHFDHKSPDA